MHGCGWIIEVGWSLTTRERWKADVMLQLILRWVWLTVTIKTWLYKNIERKGHGAARLKLLPRPRCPRSSADVTSITAKPAASHLMFQVHCSKIISKRNWSFGVVFFVSAPAKYTSVLLCPVHFRTPPPASGALRLLKMTNEEGQLCCGQTSGHPKKLLLPSASAKLLSDMEAASIFSSISGRCHYCRSRVLLAVPLLLTLSS